MGSQTLRYLWDGMELLAELDTQGNLLKSYTHGIEVDEILYQEDYTKQETLFFHQDHLESTLALTDSTGALKERKGQRNGRGKEKAVNGEAEI